MTTPLDRAFFAGDAHDHWARRINTADKSIWILTPQIDETLVDLLDGATAPEVVVLTSVRPDVAGPDYRQHLLGVRALLANGIDVRSTIRPLSAHVLVCDGRLVTAGSQPFNADGRTVDAVTCGPENNIDGSGFQVTIRSWMDAGRSLEMVVVETLLDVLDVSISVVENAQRDLIDEFEFVSAGMMVGEPDAFGGEPASAVTDDAVLHRSEHRELRSGTGPDGGVLRRVADGLVRTLADDRRASGERVFARLQMNGEGWDSYWSLVPDGDADLTEWVQPLQDGSTQRVRLERLMVYPVILNPSGRMGFARVGKTRITYVREAVHWTSGVAVAGVQCDLEVSFPVADFERSNLHLTLKPVDRSKPGALLRLRFDGSEAILRDLVELQGGDGNRYVTSNLQQSFEDALGRTNSLNDLLASALRPFRYERLGRDERNAHEFFPSGPQEVGLFRFGVRSVLAVSSVSLPPSIWHWSALVCLCLAIVAKAWNRRFRHRDVQADGPSGDGAPPDGPVRPCDLHVAVGGSACGTALRRASTIPPLRGGVVRLAARHL